jgi:hypothetical protein
MASPEPAVPYNSEEHRLIVDQGVAAVQVPSTIRFPDGTGVRQVTPAAYVAGYREAKRLAVGFESNNPGDFDGDKASVQDNCYFEGKVAGGFEQVEYNKTIYIPAQSQAPAQIFTVPAHNATVAYGAFTLGQLAALYGDYRKTTFCDASGRCFLTNADIGEVVFERGNALRSGTYCPPKINAGRYLQAIGSGLVPPFGVGANTTRNTANDDEYQEAGWWGDEMLRIANINDWHFSNGAISWYIGLHRLALLYADSARTDPKHWNRALHYEANALHSLTDLFAFGHVVTNRDETSFGIMKGFGGNRAYQWMENVTRMGGGTRSASGMISLSPTLPAIRGVAGTRNEFVKSDRGTWAVRADGERRYHNEFNKSGAQVRNLNGDDFQIFGDARLSQMLNGTAVGVIRNAVTASVQSLIDAHADLGAGKTVADIGTSGSSYFAALKYVPVFIVRDANGYFPGKWARYADAISKISGVNKPLSNLAGCQVAYLSGVDGIQWPPKPSGPCTTF